MPVLEKTKRVVGEDIEAFYSIKIGRADEKGIRDYCLDNGMIAINFNMTLERHNEILKRINNTEELRAYLEIEFKGIHNKTFWVNQHLHFYNLAENIVWVTTYESKFYYAHQKNSSGSIDEIKKLFEEPDENGWVKRKIDPKIGIWTESKEKKSLPELPGQIRNLSVQRQTIIGVLKDNKDTKDKFELIKNVLNAEKPLVKKYKNDYHDKSKSLQKIIKHLGPNDFETLIDLLLYKMAYSRESVLGGEEADIDGLYQDMRSINKDKLYTQVKCKATRDELSKFNDYVKKKKQTSQGLFAYHSSHNDKPLSLGEDCSVKIWDLPTIAEFADRLGLENWVLDKVYA